MPGNAEIFFSILFMSIKKGTAPESFTGSNLWLLVVEPLTRDPLSNKLFAKGSPNQPHPKILMVLFNLNLFFNS